MIENSLIDGYLAADSYMAKASGQGMTNRKALQVSMTDGSLWLTLGPGSDRKEIGWV